MVSLEERWHGPIHAIIIILIILVFSNNVTPLLCLLLTTLCIRYDYVLSPSIPYSYR
eukprot:gene6378-4603_t